MKNSILAILSVVVIGMGLILLSSGFNPLALPVADYEGGETGWTGEGSCGWNNDTKQTICDFKIKVKDAGGNPLTPDIEYGSEAGEHDYEVYVKVNTREKTYHNNSDDPGHFKADESDDQCANGASIVVGVSDNREDPEHEIDDVTIHFTDDKWNKIREPKDDDKDPPSQSLTLLTLSTSSTFPDDNWSLVITNKTNYPLTGFTFSESPSMTMSELYIDLSGTTNTTNKTATFTFPLLVNDSVQVSVEYTSEPTQSTTVSCTASYTEVEVESANPRQSIGEGTNISVPNIILDEVVAGAIETSGGNSNIVFEAREQFEFNSVGAATVDTGGNIVLGTPYVSSGKIYIPITSASYGEGKSKITVASVTINTLTGLSEGSISVHQSEPTGNDSNFYLAYFDPEE